MATTTHGQRIATQSVAVLNPNTESARRVFPTGEVETVEGVEYVIFENEPGEYRRSRVQESRPAFQFGFVI